ncbi:MAG: DNA mismatch repair protein MutS, partial [Spirochaetes bacterium]|nr:DNA mismatch repair protein MutS [Spirochaetota bacterium]
HRDDIAAVYETLGALDAGAAIAELLAEGGPARAAVVGEGLEGVAVSGMVHPLVDGCVPVSFRADRGIIITGTNMSGKTTFLRSLGLNMAFAGTLGFAFAESFEAHPFRVVSSVEIDDDLMAGKSRYLAEAERLLFIIKACAAGHVLALVDEILSGTNSADRIAASIDILGHLAGSGSLVVAATHDLEIAEATVGSYDAFHFSERLDSGDFSFDYELKPGVVDRRNALLILRRLGFGEFVRG